MNMAKATIFSLGILSAIVLKPSLASAADHWFRCAPVNVVEITGAQPRVHVYCSNSITLNGNVVRFIAIGTGDQARANRFITFANAALLSGKRFIAAVSDSATTNVPGCSADQCRTPSQFGLE